MRKIRIIAGTLLVAILLVSACAKPTPSTGETELKYDDGTSDGSASAGGWGFRVHFSPSAEPFNINKVKLFAILRGTGYEDQKVEVEILSHDFALLSSSQKPASEFSIRPRWVTIDIPSIVVKNDFYVYLYTNSKREGGVSIHYDSSTANQHSEYVRPSGEIAPWPWPNPKDKTNWMIRVVGTPAPPD